MGHADYASAKESLNKLLTWTVITFAQGMFTFFVKGFSDMPIAGLGTYGISFDWDLSSCGIGMILPNNINASILFGGLIANLFINAYMDGSGHLCTYETEDQSECWYVAPNMTDWSSSKKYGQSYLGARAYYFYPGVAMVLADGIYSVAKLIHTLVKDAMSRQVANTAEDEESDPAEAAREQKLVELFLDSKFSAWMLIGGYCCSAAVAMVLLDSVFPWHGGWFWWVYSLLRCWLLQSLLELV